MPDKSLLGPSTYVVPAQVIDIGRSAPCNPKSGTEVALGTYNDGSQYMLFAYQSDLGFRWRSPVPVVPRQEKVV